MIDRLLNAAGILAVLALLGLAGYYSFTANERAHAEEKAHPLFGARGRP